MATKVYKIRELLKFQKKSHRKAGEGLSVGRYPFFTSSQIQKKWLNEVDYSDEAIILGTGGSPSVHLAKGFSTSSDVFILAPINRDISAKYISFFLLGNKHLLGRGFKGAGLKHISRDYVEKIEIPIPIDEKGGPDIKEQSRVADILEEVEGIKKKRFEADQKMEQVVPALFNKMFGNIQAKKSTHPWGTIRQHVHAESGKSSKSVLSDTETGFPVYGGNGINGWAKHPLYEKPVIIAGRVGQQCGVIHISQRPCWVTDNAIVITIEDAKKLNPIYLADALRNSSLRKTVEQLDLPYINQSILLDASIPMPRIELQNQYAELVKETELQKEKQKVSAMDIDTLFPSLLASLTK